MKKSEGKKTVIIAQGLAIFIMALGMRVLAYGGVERAPEPEESAISYRIVIDVDYSRGGFKGRQKVRIVNTRGDDLNEVVFNLYPNFGLASEDTPWLRIDGVRQAGRLLKYELRARQAFLRVSLPESVRQGGVVELEIDFSAVVPRVQREESSLLAHFLQEISDAVSDEKHLRDARDIFFAGDDVWLLGYFNPQVAIGQYQSFDSEFVAGVGGIVLADPADYDVTVNCSDRKVIIASGRRQGESGRAAEGDPMTARFIGKRMRGFAVIVADRMRSVESRVDDVRIVSHFRDGDERLGERVLGFTQMAVRTYLKAFGAYPHDKIEVVELPLAAGFCTVDLPGIIAVAQAYYIDFEQPTAARLPGVLREQSDVIRSALEFNLALSVAHQWWGEVVANNSEKSPWLDESLSAFSAAYYHEAAYGKQLGELIVQQQLRGVYQAYRMLGGTDLEADRPIRDFRNALQYSAIASTKGALLLVALRAELGDERFFKALQYYYETHRFRVVAPEHLRYAFLAAAEDTRRVRVLFQRWLREKRGDEDIGAPDLALIPQPVSKIRALGRLFVKIGKTAAKPF